MPCCSTNWPMDSSLTLSRRPRFRYSRVSPSFTGRVAACRELLRRRDRRSPSALLLPSSLALASVAASGGVAAAGAEIVAGAVGAAAALVVPAAAVDVRESTQASQNSRPSSA